MKVVFFSGAGMSAESGIGTFRDKGGLWENHRIEDVATPEAWKRNPDLVTEFYNLRRKKIIETEPNKAHFAIAQLENIIDVHVITQNIDDLHERAGSKKVLHLHGNIKYAKSSGPNQDKKYYLLKNWNLTKHDLCDEGYRLRPHVVWFGESVPAFDEAAEIIKNADIFIVIGTSLQVYPAAGLIQYANNAKTKILVDPNANSINGIEDFKVYSNTATEGVLLAINEIKKNIE
ncbi:MAG: SIR2 family NAD-dependent protein deacylase [Crocinitomicaceae bacterium]